MCQGLVILGITVSIMAALCFVLWLDHKETMNGVHDK